MTYKYKLLLTHVLNTINIENFVFAIWYYSILVMLDLIIVTLMIIFK